MRGNWAFDDGTKEIEFLFEKGILKLIKTNIKCNDLLKCYRDFRVSEKEQFAAKKMYLSNLDEIIKKKLIWCQVWPRGGAKGKSCKLSGNLLQKLVSSFVLVKSHRVILHASRVHISPLENVAPLLPNFPRLIQKLAISSLPTDNKLKFQIQYHAKKKWKVEESDLTSCFANQEKFFVWRLGLIG